MALSMYDVVDHLQHLSPSLARAGGEDRGGKFFTGSGAWAGRTAAVLMAAVSSRLEGGPTPLGGDLRSDWPWIPMELLHISLSISVFLKETFCRSRSYTPKNVHVING